MNRYTRIFDSRGGLYNRATGLAPLARETERRLLVERLSIATGLRVLDVPAGGGYLADGLRQAEPTLRVVCLEPSAAFAAAIDTRHVRVHGSVEAMPFAPRSFDRVGSLSGMHHLDDPAGFVRECVRVAAPGAVVALADVGRGTAPAAFLNGPVDRWTETGHDGRFFATGDLGRLLRAAGCRDVSESLCRYTWDFPDLAALVAFCHELFGMVRADVATVETALREHFALSVDAKGAHLPWALVYATGRVG